MFLASTGTCTHAYSSTHSLKIKQREREERRGREKVIKGESHYKAGPELTAREASEGGRGCEFLVAAMWRSDGRWDMSEWPVAAVMVCRTEWQWCVVLGRLQRAVQQTSSPEARRASERAFPGTGHRDDSKGLTCLGTLSKSSIRVLNTFLTGLG